MQGRLFHTVRIDPHKDVFLGICDQGDLFKPVSDRSDITRSTTFIQTCNTTPIGSELYGAVLARVIS